jgi:hypothetical protein
MRTAKVVESVDIDAPRDHVFEILANYDRRLQLSPLWGTTEIEDVTPDFPHEGSGYHVKLTGDEGVIEEYDTIVTAFVPAQKFAYRLTAKRQPQATWTVQDVPRGTRLIYCEEFLVDEAGDEEFVQSVRQVVTGWLSNIKRYAELKDTWIHRPVKWVLDRYLLKLRVEQRRVILMLLLLQVATILSFIALGIGLAVANLIF